MVAVPTKAGLGTNTILKAWPLTVTVSAAAGFTPRSSAKICGRPADAVSIATSVTVPALGGWTLTSEAETNGPPSAPLVMSAVAVTDWVGDGGGVTMVCGGGGVGTGLTVMVAVSGADVPDEFAIV